MRIASKLTLLLALAAAMLIPSVAAARDGSPPRIYGRSLAEWMTDYWTWYLGGAESDGVGKVKFMPLPQGEYVEGSGTLDDPLVLAGSLELAFPKATPFVMGVAGWIGETYEPTLEIPDDTPLDASVFLDSNVLVTIDGKRVIDSERGRLDRFYYGPAEFDPPVLYSEPTSYGAIGAIWTQGLGFVHPPLSRGVHVMRVSSELRIPEFNLHVIFHNEWEITVE